MWITKGLYDTLPLLYASFGVFGILIGGISLPIIVFSSMLFVATYLIVKMRITYRVKNNRSF